jgi:hypothetical protein
VKRRFLEYLAVRKLNPNGKSPIVCFVGPPGVGKTSLGQSIAHATGRKFVRLASAAFMTRARYMDIDVSISAPCPAIQSIHKAGTRNPVMMLDEMDKLGAGFHGDPAAALLEVLDPEQNASFRDTYLGIAFDLSKVMFIGTANVIDNIPGPVRDRMEVIEMPGYIEEEKLAIAKRWSSVSWSLRGCAKTNARSATTCCAQSFATIPVRRREEPRAPDRRTAPVRRHANRRRRCRLRHHYGCRPSRHPGAETFRAGDRHAYQGAGRGHLVRLATGRRRHPVR